MVIKLEIDHVLYSAPESMGLYGLHKLHNIYVLPYVRKAPGAMCMVGHIVKLYPPIVSKASTQIIVPIYVCHYVRKIKTTSVIPALGFVSIDALLYYLLLSMLLLISTWLLAISMLTIKQDCVYIDVLIILDLLEHLGIMIPTLVCIDALLIVLGTGRLLIDIVYKYVLRVPMLTN